MQALLALAAVDRPLTGSAFGRPSFGCGHLTVDVDLLALGIGLPAILPFLCAFPTPTFLLLRIALAFVGTFLALVCHLLALFCGLVTLISCRVSLVGDPLPPCHLILTPRDHRLAFARLAGGDVIGPVRIALIIHESQFSRKIARSCPEEDYASTARTNQR
jgi:hypothetical protein